MLNLNGKIRIRVIGAYNEQFISALIRRKIRLSNITSKDGVVYADVKASSYRKIAALSREYGTMVRIQEKNGIIFRLSRHKSRYGVYIGLIAAAVSMLILRQFLWRIEVHGNDKFSDDYLLKQLELCGITAGTPISGIDTTAVERRIKLANDGIGWLNLEINGSRADLYLSESNIPKKPDISLNTPCNVISTHDALIIDTELYAGTLLYKKGSYVGKGSIIVSGAVNDGHDNIVYTHADAKIIAEFTEELEFRQELATIEKAPTGEKEVQKQLMIFGFAAPLYITPIETDGKICDEEIESFRFMGVEMPWKIKTETYTSYNEITVKRTAEDAQRLLQSRLELYCFDMYKDYEVIDISTEYDYAENCVTLSAAVKLKGDITELKPIYVKEN